MHRRAVPSLGFTNRDESVVTLGEQDPATPIRSRDNFLPSRSRPASRTGQARPFPYFDPLSLLSLALHSLLILVHVILLGVWSKRLEHRVTFSLKNQKTASFLITAISTTIGTLYSASLVFITQTLSMRRSLQRPQTLTETHDNAVAWIGIGSAIMQLWSQKAVPASVFGVFSTFLYLLCVLILHVTTPALFALEAFNATQPVLVDSQGLPSYNWSNETNGFFGDYETLIYFIPQPLSVLPFVFQGYIPTLGLHNGSMYEVLAPNEGFGNIAVKGTKFDITCGYIPDLTFRPVDNTSAWNVTGPPFQPYYEIIEPTQPGIIVPINRTFLDTILFYTTIPILDSNSETGPTYALSPPLGNATSAIQVMGCSLALINQTAVVDAQARTLLSLKPELNRTESNWAPYSGPLDMQGSAQSNFTSSGNPFLDLWGLWYTFIPPSDVGLLSLQDDHRLSLADFQLNQMLNLFSPTDRPENVSLHIFENSLSAVIASMFWALGNIPAFHGFMLGSSGNGTTTIIDQVPVEGIPSNLQYIFQRPYLIPGKISVTTFTLKARLNLSIIAVISGFIASILLLLLSLPSSLFSRRNETGASLDGMGFLHSIWLYRNHRELETLLVQVDDPTQDNLRAAGMVKTALTNNNGDTQETLLLHSIPSQK
ncbi:hypothetical protein R3P38DRAFT_2979971 [Favolaschia claudopus]|uniref:Uncharacterized protein n=1 Tax=Favolaschia claudopus TaxID=2862362 RepID=A0AAW0B1P1_9AGAR